MKTVFLVVGLMVSYVIFIWAYSGMVGINEAVKFMPYWKLAVQDIISLFYGALIWHIASVNKKDGS
jgi:hypothetical protein